MSKISYKLLIAQKDVLATEMATAIANGESTNFLSLMIEGRYFSTYDVPSDIVSLQQIEHNFSKAPFPSSYNSRAFAPGDVVLDSNGVAMVYAGSGDFNDVSAKFMDEGLFPGGNKSTIVDELSTDADDEDDDEDDVKAGTPCQDVCCAPKTLSKSSLRVGEMKNTRSIERKEMQALIQTSLGQLFTEQGIPMTKDHTRRTVRSLLRIGVQLMMNDLGKDPAAAMAQFVECMRDEAGDKTAGKKITVVTY